MGPDEQLIDELAHACLYAGAQLSRAVRSMHNLGGAALLQSHRADHRMVLTDTVFSMDGDQAPVAELQASAKRTMLASPMMPTASASCQPQPGALKGGTLSKALAAWWLHL